jgi:hypothetical protein
MTTAETTYSADRTKRFRLTPTGQGSEHYGPCEVCGERFERIYILVTEKPVTNPDGSTGWAQEGRTVFGCLECLLKLRGDQ